MTNVSNNVKVNAGKQPIYDCRIPMGTSISMTGSIFGGFNFGSSYGNFDFGNMDLMMPVWMQSNPYAINQFDFTGINNYAGYNPTTALGCGNAQPQAGDFTSQYSYNPFAQNGVTNPFVYPTTDGVHASQNPDGVSAGAGAGNGTATATGTGASARVTSAEAQELNMYGISTTGDKAKDAKALKDVKAKQEKIEAQAAQIAEELYDSMKGAGTKNDKLKAAVSKITKDNVLHVLEAWNKNFSDAMDGETLIESIQAEHYTGWFGHQQEDLENHIKDALYAKGQELGLKNESHAFRAKINSEHSAWFTSDSVVNDCFNNFIAQVAQKDAQVKAEKATRAMQNNK